MTVKVNKENLSVLLAKYQTEFKGSNYKERKRIVQTFVNELLSDFLKEDSDSGADDKLENEISYMPPDEADIYINYNG